MNITLRPYLPADWKNLCEIHDLARMDELKNSAGVAAFLSLEETYENEELFAGELWVACMDDLPVGFAAFTNHELTWLYVHPVHYKKGIGQQLLKKAIERCGGNITTEVLSGNEAALNLYLKEGFVIKEVKKGKLAGNESFAAEGILLAHLSIS
jgi:GNAT superfamily N-acetyltransferase